MPRKKAPEDSRRAQSVRAGHHVASRAGLQKLTVRLAATKAMLSTGLVHFYSRTKDRLLAAVRRVSAGRKSRRGGRAGAVLGRKR